MAEVEHPNDIPRRDGPLDSQELRAVKAWLSRKGLTTPATKRIARLVLTIDDAEARCEAIARHFGWEGASCSDPSCICGKPRPVCEEFMGTGDQRCPRCGWRPAAHQEGSGE